MANDKKQSHSKHSSSHMPDTNLYEKVIPAVLIGLGLLTAVLILIGLGIAVGIIPY